ncbi:flagellin B [Helicobacter sp. MIT 00-7814]|uniref:flagellin A n=1 Tax=unclassified Helicobacter TaxID=2593540 RepID=UPI000E1F4B58|nr:MULTISPECIES: flagellin A [unclassified Helicobacter]RDU54202.1 flagellin B [Helicobacter sp. MIT 00-7814]RDU56052.1 flagellin B [Helicobacter sp. MIT 99-10781]
MAFQVNTNINALNSHVQGVFTQNSLKSSLEKLSSGLRINKAADDASGMTIADSLRSQASALGQAIKNTNDGMGIIQIADKAMDEQIKILDTIKVKAVQAAQDGQSTQSRQAIQADIKRLIEGLDMIGNTTTYNGQALLSGAFSNKEFQVGAYSNQSIKASIGSTTSDKIGQARIETGQNVTSTGEVKIKFINVDGINDVELESVKISTSAGTGLGNLAEVINKNSDKTGVRAQANVITTSDDAIKAGSLGGVVLNGVTIGDIIGIRDNDSDGRLVQAINAATQDTGVEAYTDNLGRLNLRSTDGRGISFVTTGVVNQPGAGQGGQGQQGQGALAIDTVNGGQNIQGTVNNGVATGGSMNLGRLSLVRTDARDILVSGTGVSATGYSPNQTVAEATVNLREVTGSFGADIRSAAGGNYNGVFAAEDKGLGAGVTSLRGAMVVMDIAESATKMLDKIRADLGSVQGQMVSTVNNISVTQVNVKAAESQIREVDFAAESTEFSKLNILAQSGSYALSQANAVQQNILRLLN